MPFYYRIDEHSPKERRIAEGLLRLKDGIQEAGIPSRTIEETLMLATWNIREFESAKYGSRVAEKEPLFYIAEIISCFDLVAVQEVRDDLSALEALLKLLGGWWKAVYTDVTEGTRGNRERMAFLYDSRKLRFGGLAGEVVIPPVRKRGQELTPADQFWRTPFIVGFEAGWFKFTICTVHILYGKAAANHPQREQEIREIARFLAARVKAKHAWASNMILLGDFNIFSPNDVTFKALLDAGFQIPPELSRLPSNAARNKHYDQIAFIAPDMNQHLKKCKAGVFDLFRSVYRDADESTYKPEFEAAYPKAKFKEWRTYKMSDHLPMWVELKIDFGREYLQRKAAGSR